MHNELMNRVQTAIKQARRDEHGATMVEYGLLISLIAIVVVPVLLLLGPAIAALFQQVINNL